MTSNINFALFSVFFQLLVITRLNFVYGAEILFVTSTPSYGGQMALQPLWRELSKSHKVTVITPNPLNDPKLKNLTEISVKFVYEVLEFKYDYSSQVMKYKDEPLRYSTYFLNALTGINRDILEFPEVRVLIHDETKKFDMVITEFMVPTTLAFAHRFKCPLVAVTSTDASILGQDAVGNPNHPAINPDLMLKFNGELSFTQRVFSTLSLVSRRVISNLLKRVEDETVAKYFGDNYPSLGELTDNIDLFLMNVNVAFHNLRPTVPAVVHFGGSMSIREPVPLPHDIKKFLDDAKEGAVYFSMGTVVKAKMLTPEFLQAVFVAFSNMPYKFVVKLDLPEDFEGKPDNVLLRNWLPQQDVLRHPNVKVFVTQCGLQSLEEAIYYNVPIVGIPYFGDQFSNCLQAERKGMGRILDMNRLDARKLMANIEDVMNRPTFEEKTKELAKIALDQPMSGLDKSLWWIEHVLRYKGAKHLKAPSLNVPFWKFYLLDVLAFVSLVMFLLLGIIYFAIKKCLGLCFRKHGKDDKTKSKTQ